MADEGAGSLRWWDKRFADNKARAEACLRWANRIRQRHDLRQRIHVFNAQMYDDLPSMGLGPFQYASYDVGGDRLKMNLIKAVTDTYVAMISRSKPKPKILTSDGDWSLKKKAKGLTRWFEGKAEEIDLYGEVSNPVCRDSAVFGLGIAKVFREWPHDKALWDVGVERVFPWELIADDAEWQTKRRARNLGQHTPVDRIKLSEMFPKHREWILGSATKYGADGGASSADTTADLIEVVELWHLPSYPEAGDGRHCIVTKGKTLYDGEWDRQRFPFAMFYRARPTQGLWGLSIPHQLRGRQLFINQALMDIEDCLHLYGKPKVIAQAGSIETDAWSDDVDDIMLFNGQVAPTVYTPSVMPAELYSFLREQWQGGFDEIGISQSRGGGQLPEGLSGSGASIRAWNGVEDGRMYESSQLYEDGHMAVADLMIDEARDIAKEKKDFASTYRGKVFVQVVNFREVDPGKDKFFMRPYPVSSLSDNFSERQAQLQELLNGKVIDVEAFREMLEFPDLQAEDNLMNSPRELSEKLIERFLDADDPTDPEVFQYPEPEWPLAAMKVRFQYAEIRARLDGAPEGNCRLLRNFIALCDKLPTALTPPAPPGGPVPPGAAGPTGPGQPGLPPPPNAMNLASPTLQ